MSEATSISDQLTGRPIGGYLLLRRIGSGGMADVYLAEQKSLGRQVALKILHGALAHDATYVERFHNEARAAAALVHPNIVQIYEVGQADGYHFIAQEFVAGKSLEEILERQGSLEQGLVLEVVRQVAAALCKAAEVGIVHRDIKPGNILLSTSGIVKVADFGLARVLSVDKRALTQVGIAMGTPLYMSPEQIEGKSVDIRSDVYSLGVTCYHLLAGQPPHTGDTALAIAVQHLNKDPRPLGSIRQDIAERFEKVVHRMMARQPGDRYSSPAELMSDLKALAIEANEQGWAAGAEQWSLVEWIAERGATGASAELSSLMKEETRLQRPQTRWSILLLPALVVGAALGWLIEPRFLLRDSRDTEIPVRESPGAQLFHAKVVEREEAWRAVWESFPDADSFYKQLAQQGLVRHWLFISQDPDYAKALTILSELSQQAGSSESLRAFVLAAECICHERLGHSREADAAYSQLTSGHKDYLARNEAELSRLLESSRTRPGN